MIASEAAQAVADLKAKLDAANQKITKLENDLDAALVQVSKFRTGVINACDAASASYDQREFLRKVRGVANRINLPFDWDAIAAEFENTPSELARTELERDAARAETRTLHRAIDQARVHFMAGPGIDAYDESLASGVLDYVLTLAGTPETSAAWVPVPKFRHRYLGLVVREPGMPIEIRGFDDLREAREFRGTVFAQWSESYVLRVIEGPCV